MNGTGMFVSLENMTPSSENMTLDNGRRGQGQGLALAEGDVLLHKCCCSAHVALVGDTGVKSPDAGTVLCCGIICFGNDRETNFPERDAHIAQAHIFKSPLK